MSATSGYAPTPADSLRRWRHYGRLDNYGGWKRSRGRVVVVHSLSETALDGGSQTRLMWRGHALHADDATVE
jgi:hypothetical protein